MVQQISTDDERFMRAALAEARAAAAEGEVPVGAVVVCGGRVVARAHNCRETDADPSAHAEFRALLEASRALGRWRLSDCTVYVTLEPCAMCAGLMVNARVGRCVYGAADPKGGALGSLYQLNADVRLNHVFEVRAGVLEAECAGLLREFFEGLRERRAAEGGRSEVEEGCCAPDAPAVGARRPARVLLAVDSFKGSATSGQVEAWLAEGVRRALPDAQVAALPIADGGEGTVEAVHAARGGTWRAVEVHGPFGVRHTARYLLVGGMEVGAEPAGAEPEGAASVGAPEPEGSVASTGEADAVTALGGERQPCGPDEGGCAARPAFAVVEMAEAAGIGRSPCTLDAALDASTWGVGELLFDAAAQGARELYVGLGGSATNDGGAGMLQALGARLLDAEGRPVASGLRGLAHVVSIDLAPALQALEGVHLTVLTDVTNPLVGPRGALATFGPQKGLRFEGDGDAAAGAAGSVDECDRWMGAYAAKLTAARDALDGTPLQVGAPGARPRQLASVPGAGAAGGLGAAFLALGARLTSGIQTVLDLAGFDEAARAADLVVTGEGNMDAQTASGKAPVGVAQRAKAANPQVTVVAVCGGRADDLGAVYEAGIDVVLPIPRRPMALEEALTPEQTRANLIAAGETAARIAMLAR